MGLVELKHVHGKYFLYKIRLYLRYPIVGAGQAIIVIEKSNRVRKTGGLGQTFEN